MFVKLGQQGRVILDIHHDIDEGVVLGRRADHRRAADIDILDRRGVIRPAGATAASNG